MFSYYKDLVFIKAHNVEETYSSTYMRGVVRGGGGLFIC